MSRKPRGRASLWKPWRNDRTQLVSLGQEVKNPPFPLSFRQSSIKKSKSMLNEEIVLCIHPLVHCLPHSQYRSSPAEHNQAFFFSSLPPLCRWFTVISQKRISISFNNKKFATWSSSAWSNPFEWIARTLGSLAHSNEPKKFQKLKRCEIYRYSNENFSRKATYNFLAKRKNCLPRNFVLTFLRQLFLAKKHSIWFRCHLTRNVANCSRKPSLALLLSENSLPKGSRLQFTAWYRKRIKLHWT